MAGASAAGRAGVVGVGGGREIRFKKEFGVKGPGHPSLLAALWYFFDGRQLQCTCTLKSGIYRGALYFHHEQKYEGLPSGWPSYFCS